MLWRQVVSQSPATKDELTLAALLIFKKTILLFQQYHSVCLDKIASFDAIEVEATCQSLWLPPYFMPASRYGYAWYVAEFKWKDESA